MSAWVIAWLLISAGSVWAADVNDPQWGFDGRVRSHRFNLLTVTVDNPAPNPVELKLVLSKTVGQMNTVDAPIVEEVYLSPGQRRTVQFYPYVSDWSSVWRLSYGGKVMEIQQPRPSRRGARVLLEAADVLGDTRGSVRRFPENQFPPFVTATDTLQAVLIDHVPNWEETRRQAFLDWLYRGGAVFVLQSPTGKFPQFPGAMHEFNSPLEAVPYGSGVIRRVAMSRNQLTKESLKELWKGLPNQVAVESTTILEPGVAPPQKSDDDEDDPNAPFNYSDGSGSITSRSFLEELAKMSKPDHNWILLHFMFWIYILLIFPGGFIIGQKWNDFRIVYGALIGVVFLFSLAFGYVGQRSYGEPTMVHSVAIAQPLPDGYLDVASWSNAFITRGGEYDIRHKGTGTLYSTCQESEAVLGGIRNGNEGLFRVDIPPFSSREFAHRMKVKATLPAVRIASIDVEGNSLRQVTLDVDQTFPQSDHMYLLYRDRFYSVARQGHRISLRSNIGAVPAFLRMEQNSNYYGNFGYGQDQSTPEKRYYEMFYPLATRSLNIRSLTDAQSVRWSPDHVRLMYFADPLPEFAVQNNRFSSQQGRVLYCVDLPITDDVPKVPAETAK